MRVTTSLLCAAVGLVLQQATAFLSPASFPSSKPASATVLRMAAEAVEVPMDLIKKLRGMSGAPIMDCKKALAEEKLDVEAAFDWLRKKGQATIAKRDRATKEGLVALAVDGTRGVAVEVNSETDFVARNADFQGFVAGAAKTALGLTQGAKPGVSDMEHAALIAVRGG
ncbi:elongation factor ts, partial [Nannochloropsis gaditana]